MALGNFYLTAAGNELLAKAQTGAVLTITRAQIGEGVWPDGTTYNNITALVSPIKYLTIASKTMSSGQAKLSVQFTNQDVGRPFKWTEFGLWAANPDAPDDRGQDILYGTAYAQDTPVPIEAALTEFLFNVLIKTGQATNVTIVIDSSIVYMTRRETEILIDQKIAELDLDNVAKAEILNISIPTEAWTRDDGENLAYAYYADVIVENALPTHYPSVALFKEDAQTASDAGMASTAQAMAGKVRFWAKEPPGAVLNANLSLLSGQGSDNQGYGIVNVGTALRINVPGGVAGVGEDGKIPEELIPEMGGGYITMDDSIPPEDRQPNTLYGQIIDNFVGTPSSASAATLASVGAASPMAAAAPAAASASPLADGPTLLGDVPVGTIVKLNVSGQPTNFIVVNQGIPQNSPLYDASCNGTWLLMQDCYIQLAWNVSDTNDYANSTINAYLNGTFFGLLDADIQATIPQVKIPYRPGSGNNNNNVNTGANGLPVKVFLLGGYEVGLTYSESFYRIPVDGAALTYFTPSSAEKRVAKLNGNPNPWTLRSPTFTVDWATDRVAIINSDGSYPQNGESASGSYGVRPAMILPQSLYVLPDGTITTNSPPTAPGSIEASNVVSGQTATITLTAATDPDGTIASYIVERSVDGSSGWQQVANANSLTATDSISSDWGTVQYRACAVDNLGVSGPYITSDTYDVNAGWILIGGPASNMGVQSVPFNFNATIGVSGQVGVTGIQVTVKLDGAQVYSDTVNQAAVVSVPINTRVMGSGQHEIQVVATKEDLLSAVSAYVFVVPSIALPDGGTSQVLEDSQGNPVFPVTSARYVIGSNGKDVQAEIDQINNAHRGTTGHLAFVDAVLGPASKTYPRASGVTYAIQGYAPANTSNPGGLLCIYAAYIGQLDTFLNATAEELIFNIPANVILTLYEYVLDAAPPAETDPTVNFNALAQPKVLTAATNTGNTADSLNAALTAMMAAFPTQNYYLLTDPAGDVTYYVASQATIAPGTTSATCAYVSSANPTTWYQGVQLTFINTSNIPALFTPLNPPMVASATSANAVTVGSTLSQTLLAMIQAQPTYKRYQMEDSSGTTYYVLSSTQLTTDSLTASNVLYCTESGTYYNGETLKFVPAEFPNPADLTLGNTISWAGQSWIVSHKTETECYLTLAGLDGNSVYDAGGSAVYAGSDLANRAMQFQNGLTEGQLACLKDVTVNGVTAKVFVASQNQMDSGFEYFNSDSSRSVGSDYWTSSANFSYGSWYVQANGSFFGYGNFGGDVTSSLGFRPSVCLDLSLLG